MIEKSLLEPVFEAHVDSTLERNVACYLDRQKALVWWHRNVARTQYGLQGWKRNKVYPDIVFALDTHQGQRKWVLPETKGLHLKNEDTTYKQDLLAALSRIQTSSGAPIGELALEDGNSAGIVCDLVFDEDCAGTLCGRYFNTNQAT